MAKWSLLLVSVAASAALGYGYLGPESCQGCHPDAYAAWRATPHARAKDTLSQTQQRDARCLSCHSPAEAEQQVSNVSCESCHGGGQYYSARYVMKDTELSRLVGLVDPACYHGDAEVDLAMLDLFCSPPEAFREGYGAPAPGWRERQPIYQLFPALAHVRLWGAGYFPMVDRLLAAAGA